MNSLKRVLFKCPMLLLCVIGTVVYGQKESKTYNEVFNTTPETVLDINTSNADIEFETWGQDQIEIIATITLEGATKEEAAAYFKRGAFDIQGNSNKVRISSGAEKSSLFFGHNMAGFDNFHFDHESLFPSGLEMDSLFLALPSIDSQNLFFDFSMMDEMPPMPPMPKQNFDYQAFKEDGEKYLKEWQKEFSKGFNKEYEKKLEEWSKKIEKRAKAMEKKQKEREALREERAEKLEKVRAERNEKRLEAQEKLAAERDKAREKRREPQSHRRSIWIRDNDNHDESNIYYFPSQGTNKNYKVKKTLKIKMPKGLKIQMDVRHGEVTLAENTKNINANLSYSNLRAFTIDGEETTIVASYSPIAVQKWNYGQLQADYSDNVDLEEVTNLRLIATSSDVTIDKILDKLYVKSKYGPLKINKIGKNFSDIDVSLQNSELECKTPDTPFAIYVNATSSKFACPAELNLVRTKNHNTIVQKGYHISKNKGGSIIINSKYSDVIFD